MDGDPRKLRVNIGSTKIILAERVEGNELIPIDIRTRLAPQSISINELGKQLLKAAGEGDAAEIRKLMTKGAPFTADWLGTSSLHLAAQYNHLEVCELLLRAGICRDARTKVDRTPLHIAAYEGHVEIVECLLKHHADFDCRDMLNMTPLHWAAQNGHSEVAGILIRYGASTNLTNKFDLTAADLALQIDRHDIIEIINVAIRDPLIATQHLQLEMTGDSNDTVDPVIDLIENGMEPSVPIETMLIEDEMDSENSIDPESLGTRQADVDEAVEDNGSLSESFRYLQEHGITMLPVEEDNILSSVMESGHSVVLTGGVSFIEAGKQVLNSIKPAETLPVMKSVEKPLKHNSLTTVTTKKIITITPEEFLAMTNGNLTNKILKQASGKYVTVSKNNIRRVVMKKNKIVPVSGNVNLKANNSGNDIESVRTQLNKALKLLDEYKAKLKKKEAEVERYKQQVRILLDAS